MVTSSVGIEGGFCTSTHSHDEVLLPRIVQRFHTWKRTFTGPANMKMPLFWVCRILGGLERGKNLTFGKERNSVSGLESV